VYKLDWFDWALVLVVAVCIILWWWTGRGNR
jgi:hypothetical protein